MDDATVDADLFGDPSSNAFSDQLLGNEEARVEAAAAAAAELRRASQSRTQSGQLSEPTWRSSRRIVQTEVSVPVDLRGLEYVQEVDDNLFCPICHSPLVSPVMLKCEHSFCDECLRNALDSQGERIKTCPACRGVTSMACIGPAPKLVSRMLDDAKVRCPLKNRGCAVVLQRGIIQNHVDLYCDYGETDCSDSQCDLKVQRRFADGPCLHNTIECPSCNREVMERDLEYHHRNTCEASYANCSDCTDWIQLSKMAEHLQQCPEADVACTAAPYGCDFVSKRRSVDMHLSTCPLNKLVPFLEMQKSRLDEHEAALSLFKRRTAIYEDGLANVQSTIQTSIDSPEAQTFSPPFDSSIAHVLNLHENVQNEVMHIKNSIAELDAKMEVTVLNQTLRQNEEKLHRDAIEGQMRKQLQWLVSSKLQNQRTPVVRTSSEAGPSVLKASSLVSNVGLGLATVASGSGSSSDEESERWRPRRRSSESTRQGTKL